MHMPLAQNTMLYTSQVQLHTSPWLLLGKHTRTNVCAKPLEQRSKHHVQDGRPMAEFSLAATKQSEVEPHEDITFVYRYDTTSRLLVGIASFASPLTNYIYGRWVVGSLGRTVVERLLYPRLD